MQIYQLCLYINAWYSLSILAIALKMASCVRVCCPINQASILIGKFHVIVIFIIFTSCMLSTLTNYICMQKFSSGDY